MSQQATTKQPPAESSRVRLAARFSPETLAVLPVLLPVTLIGAVATVLAARSFVMSDPSLGTIAGVLTLLGAATISEAYPVPLEGVAAGRTSLATVFIAAAATLYGWAPATLLAVLTMVLVEVARRKPPVRVAYNSSVYALSAAAAGGLAATFDSDTLAGLTGRTVLASCGYYAVNIALLSAVVARSSGEHWLPSLRRFVTWTWAPFGIMASLSVILVVLWDRSPFVAVVLVGPLMAISLYERRMYGVFERLRELDRLKDEFIAVVSHELRTPLSSVYGAAMTLQSRELDPAARESMLAIIYRESDRLARLVDQVLWASRLESERTDVNIEPLDAASVAREVVDAARAHAPEALSIDFLAQPVPEIAGDRDKVKQVLVNLLENAVKYSPDGGRVAVTLENAGPFVRFTVEDEGIGIPPDEQRRIFEKFYRLDPNLTRGVGGTGLGLYICHELIRRMNGRIWVSSQVGKGSTFSFELPRSGAPV